MHQCCVGMEISIGRSGSNMYRLLTQQIEYKLTRTGCRKQSILSHKIYGSLTGDAPIIVLHGLLGSKRMWNSMSDKLHEATKRAIIAADLRNHGESFHSPSHRYLDLAEDVKNLMGSLKLNAATVLGHSMGGRTAMTLALTEPKIVTNLIVVDISPVHKPNVLSDFFPRLVDLMRSINFNEAKNITLARDTVRNKLKASDLDIDVGTINFVLLNVVQKGNTFHWKCNIDALKENFSGIASFPDELAGNVYPGPALLIAGGKSHFVPPTEAHTSAMKTLFPRVEVAFIAHAGHNVHVDAPDQFTRLVTDFVAKNTTK